MKYIETDPSESFIISEIKRIKNRINESLKNYKPVDETRFMKKEVTKHKADFDKLMGIPKLRKQLTALNYFLK